MLKSFFVALVFCNADSDTDYLYYSAKLKLVFNQKKKVDKHLKYGSRV